MADDIDDLLTTLVSGSKQTPASTAAIISALRRDKDFGELFSSTGARGLGPTGEAMLRGVGQNTEQLGRQAMQNLSEDKADTRLGQQLSHYTATEQLGRDQLAEEKRWHDMENQQRLDKQKMLATIPQALIDKIGHYDLPPMNNRSDRSLAVMDLVSQQYPDYDSTKFGEKNKAMTAFGSGPLGDMTRRAGVSVNHMDTLLDASKALEGWKSPLVNSVKNWWGTNIVTNPKVLAFDAAKNPVNDEINAFFLGKGAGGVADRDRLLKSLSNANSYEGTKAVIDELQSLMRGQYQGLNDQYKDATGRDDFSNKIQTPRAREVFGLPPLAPPATGSGPPMGAAPAPSSALPQALGAAGLGGGSDVISPAEAQLRTATGSLPNGQAAPPTAIVDKQGIVRTGRKRLPNGKTIRVGQLADGTVVPLE